MNEDLSIWIDVDIGRITVPKDDSIQKKMFIIHR